MKCPRCNGKIFDPDYDREDPYCLQCGYRFVKKPITKLAKVQIVGGRRYNPDGKYNI